MIDVPKHAEDRFGEEHHKIHLPPLRAGPVVRLQGLLPQLPRPAKARAAGHDDVVRGWPGGVDGAARVPHAPQRAGELAPAPCSSRSPADGRRVQLSDLMEAGLVREGDELLWRRPRVGEEYRAVVTADGAIRLADGREFSSPSRAAKEAAQIPAYDGWYAWRLTRDDRTLHVLREDLARRAVDDDAP
jgi:hypothetical protein